MMTYTILSKSTNSDGSFKTTVQYNINEVITVQDVVHAAGSQLSDILLGIVNMGNMLNTQAQNITNEPSILSSIALNQETSF